MGGYIPPSLLLCLLAFPSRALGLHRAVLPPCFSPQVTCPYLPLHRFHLFLRPVLDPAPHFHTSTLPTSWSHPMPPASQLLALLFHPAPSTRSAFHSFHSTPRLPTSHVLFRNSILHPFNSQTNHALRCAWQPQLLPRTNSPPKSTTYQTQHHPRSPTPPSTSEATTP